MYRCRCDCGNEKIVRGSHLLDGTTKSCGCYGREIHSIVGKISGTKTFKHNESKTRLYRIWGNMISRCTDENNPAYCNYGGRGITVSDEWRHDYISFKNWAISSGYDESLTLDRIDNNGNYCEENCRWADRLTQANNKRMNVKYSYNGEEYTLAELSRIANIPYKTFHRRVKSLGWSIEMAMNEPINKNN